jgi:hypothetical protein
MPLRILDTIEELVKEKIDTALGRARRNPCASAGSANGTARAHASGR